MLLCSALERSDLLFGAARVLLLLLGELQNGELRFVGAGLHVNAAGTGHEGTQTALAQQVVMVIFGGRVTAVGRAVSKGSSTLRRIKTLHVLGLLLHPCVQLLRLVVVFDIVDLVEQVRVVYAKYLVLEQCLVSASTVALLCFLSDVLRVQRAAIAGLLAGFRWGCK